MMKKVNKPIIRLVLATGIILLIPLLAMQFTDEVDWGLFDFIIIGTLLMTAGLTYEFLSKKVKTTQHRIILAIVLAIALLLVWAELAVGIFGTPFAGE
jgi:hypothetical protein